MRLRGTAIGRPRLEFGVLGPVEVRAEGEQLAIGGQRQRALLAVLLLRANRVVPRAELVDALWGERPPDTAANAIQVAVHGLRRVLGAERLETHGGGYRLSVEPGELDLERFEQLTSRAEREQGEQRAGLLREALALHRGPALADLPDLPFVAAERERIDELRLVALERRIDADLDLGRHVELVPELDALTGEHPYRERFRAQLMLALYRAGRQADALEEYRRARATLRGELGLEPSKELHELEAAILRQDPSLDAPRDRESTPAAALPHPPRPLIGRELELVAITALLLDSGSSVVTLTGTGGTGKTRLALEVAHGVEGAFAGGVRFVDLSPLRDSRLVGPTVARALGVHDADEEALVERVASAVEARTLVVLDNVEHLLDSAPFVAELVARSPDLQVLATSREPLRIRTEREYRVPPLPLPELDDAADPAALAGNDAVALFLERARAARPELTLDAENARSVVGICRALDGLPLALELAAARVRLVSPAALLGRLSDRLAVLADGERDLPDRQRTLRATMDWSYGLLEPSEAVLLARLAVFTGGWTIEAAEAVADAELSALGSLADKNLVRAETLPTGETRFSMLETVREYALERLTAAGELEAIRDRHAAYFGDVAERLEPTIESAAAVEEVDREHDNIRQALEHTLARGDGAAALRLCAIGRFWYARGYLGEGAAWIERTLALEGGSPVRRARVHYVAASIAWSSGDHERAIERAQEGLRLAREVGDEIAEVGSLTSLGLAHLGAGDLLASREYHRECLKLARTLGRDRWVGIALTNIADLEVMLGNFDEADALARESLEINRRIQDVEGTGVALLVLASSLLLRGRDGETAPMIVESIRCFRRVDFRDFLVSALVALARAGAPHDPVRAARLLGAARTLRVPLGPAQFPWEQEWFERTADEVRAVLGAPRAEAELDAGSRVPADVVAEVLEDG